MIVKRFRDVQYFFFSQALADGIRITLAILLPALTGSLLGYFEIGLAVSLGAMCVSFTDAPGPVLNKRNGMLYGIGFVFLAALLTGFAQHNPYFMGLEVAVLTFFFSMFVVYGARATSVGSAAILVMVLTMGRPLPPGEVLPHAALILGGGFFYMGLSLLLYRLQPYRHAQRVLGECIREIANYLSIRADFYNCRTDLDTDYKRLLGQQVVVNEKQDLVREVLFKTRKIVEESTDESRRLVFAFVEAVDLFEYITATYYDYRSLRHQYGHTGALDMLHQALQKIVDELHGIGLAIQGNISFRKSYDYDAEVRTLKANIDALSSLDEAQKRVLKKIVVNIRKLLNSLDKMAGYFAADLKLKKTGVDHSHFVTHQPLDPKIFVDNLNVQSSGFRHAVRVCTAAILGYLLTQLLHYGTHSYWILLTIVFMVKPAFSLTRQRNIHRIFGTLVGAAFGVAVLLLLSNKTILLVIMVLLMIGTYTFMRINYLAMVLCTTPYVLILFAFLGSGYKDVAGERVLDTLVGCIIAFSVSYFLFPLWEAGGLKTYMKNMVKANAMYLQKIILALSGQKISMLEYKLARKEVYLHSANLSAAFQRMLSEPKRKQRSQSQVHQFVVLNHILFSNIATIATTLREKEAQLHHPELGQVARKAFGKLQQTLSLLGNEEVTQTAVLPADLVTGPPAALAGDALLKEQLQFIYDLSRDLHKIVCTLSEEATEAPAHTLLVPAR